MEKRSANLRVVKPVTAVINAPRMNESSNHRCCECHESQRTPIRPSWKSQLKWLKKTHARGRLNDWNSARRASGREPQSGIARRPASDVAHGQAANIAYHKPHSGSFGGFRVGHTKHNTPTAPHKMTGRINCQPRSLSTTTSVHKALPDDPLPTTRKRE